MQRCGYQDYASVFVCVIFNFVLSRNSSNVDFTEIFFAKTLACSKKTI